jgi:RNA polymerase subunit RPABC4/transcription elongation factor Spt4
LKELTRIERFRKPEECPNCGHSLLSDIVYGLVMMNDDLKRKIDERIAILGGFVITSDDLKWACTNCEQRIYKKHFD